MQELYIALVEDDEDDVVLLKECFQKYQSIEVKAYFTGKEFLDTHFNENLPCLIVIDLGLPDINGTNLIAQIKANPKLADIPIIVYTANQSPKEQKSCDDLQIQLIHKPGTLQQWDEIALLMAKHCDAAL